MRYVVIFEKAETGYGAYAPDLPGCIATAKTIDQNRQFIRQAIELHLADMQASGQTIPHPTSMCEYAEVAIH
jgi:predicted RNase H-like HicB family nuclease